MPPAKNGFWLKVAGVVLAGLFLAGVAGAWSLNARVTRNETRGDGIEKDVREIRDDVKILLRRLPSRAPPP